jgi:hypothetical protein
MRGYYDGQGQGWLAAACGWRGGEAAACGWRGWAGRWRLAGTGRHRGNEEDAREGASPRWVVVCRWSLAKGGEEGAPNQVV